LKQSANFDHAGVKLHPTSNGKTPDGTQFDFHEVGMSVSPGEQILDLTYGFDFSRPPDRRFAERLGECRSRLAVMNAIGADRDMDRVNKELHIRHVLQFAKQQCENGLGYIIVKEGNSPEWDMLVGSPDFSDINAEFLPLERCAYGLLSREDHSDSGIISNIPSVIAIFRQYSDSLKRRRGKSLTANGVDSVNILDGILKSLLASGWVKRRHDSASLLAYFTEHPKNSTTNVDRIADSLVDWVKADEFSEWDLHTHMYMSNNFPQRNQPFRDAQTGATVEGSRNFKDEGEIYDFRDPVCGEDIGDEVENIADDDDDKEEPTETQKR